jgi:serine/threonine protein kinase
VAVKLRRRDLALGERLGEGHAGEVWRARLRTSYRDLKPDDFVALKRYKRWLLHEPGQYDRIFAEVHAGQLITHPNVVKTYCMVADDESLPVLVMELCVGETLESYLDRFRNQGLPPPVDEVFGLIGPICGGLLAVHNTGFTHRDIKPANIIVTATGPKVMDLGVVSASMLAEGTTTEQFLGTIRYASPQYLLGQKASSLDDVYAVGAIAYELLVGKLFYAKDSHWAKLVVQKLCYYRLMIVQPSTVFHSLHPKQLRPALNHILSENCVWSVKEPRVVRELNFDITQGRDFLPLTASADGRYVFGLLSVTTGSFPETIETRYTHIVVELATGRSVTTIETGAEYRALRLVRVGLPLGRLG